MFALSLYTCMYAVSISKTTLTTHPTILQKSEDINILSLVTKKIEGQQQMTKNHYKNIDSKKKDLSLWDIK